MTIAICGSMDFADRMLDAAMQLENRGFTVLCPEDTRTVADHVVSRRTRAMLKKRRQLIRRHFRKIEASDAILVLNLEKNCLPGWVGANTFLEIGFAHVLGKKIYMLHPPPENSYIQDEMMGMEFELLMGSLDKIPKGG